MEWLRANATPIRLSPLDDDDFSDLEPLKRIVGNSTVVGLGEQTHGDATTFRMKARLVRYLHERLGFDVLAFETSLTDAEMAAPLLAAGAPDGVSAVRRGVSMEWSRAEQLQPFVKYLTVQARGPRPLTVTGFDFLPRKQTADSLRSLFRDAGFAEAAGSEPWDAIRDAFFAARDGKLSELPSRRENARAAVRRLRAALEGRGPFATADVIARALDSVDMALTWWIDDVLAESQDDGGVERAVETNGRDEAMAKNVIWLAEKRYPGKKIILWAASFHLLKSHEAIEPPPDLDYHGARTAGEWLGDRLVSIACTADDGKFSNHGAGTDDIKKHPRDAIESMLTRAGFENALVDLHATGSSAAWIHAPFIAGPLGYEYMRNRWDLSFDALVFTRHMEPSTLVQDEDAAAWDAGPAPDGAVGHSPK